MRDSATESAPRDLMRSTSTMTSEPCLTAIVIAPHLFDQSAAGKTQEDIFQRATTHK